MITTATKPDKRIGGERALSVASAAEGEANHWPARRWRLQHCASLTAEQNAAYRPSARSLATAAAPMSRNDVLVASRRRTEDDIATDYDCKS